MSNKNWKVVTKTSSLNDFCLFEEFLVDGKIPQSIIEKYVANVKNNPWAGHS